MLTYQLCLAGRFLNDLGVPGDVIRFRQHLSSEMAHYAIDCWDVEIETDRYSWVEIIGIADSRIMTLNPIVSTLKRI